MKCATCEQIEGRIKRLQKWIDDVLGGQELVEKYSAWLIEEGQRKQDHILRDHPDLSPQANPGTR